jgi:glycosyltransferase involved in cell wall biosynthesis
MMPSLSVIVPALNEEKNIAAALRNVEAALALSGVNDYEIIVATCVDRDGTMDKTTEIVKENAARDPRIRLLHSNVFRPLGANYRNAVLAATKEYVVMVPGDNENDSASFPILFRAMGSADMVLAYTENQEDRPWHRRALSKTYIWMLNVLFGHHLRYYNGTNLYKRELLLTALPTTESFTYASEIVLTLLKRGASYIEVPMRVQSRPGKSKALRLDNIVGVGRSLIALRKKIMAMPDVKPAEREVV